MSRALSSFETAQALTDGARLDRPIFPHSGGRGIRRSQSIVTRFGKKSTGKKKVFASQQLVVRAARLLVTGLFATRLSVILGLAGQERHSSGAACNPIRAATV